MRLLNIKIIQVYIIRQLFLLIFHRILELVISEAKHATPSTLYFQRLYFLSPQDPTKKKQDSFEEIFGTISH